MPTIPYLRTQADIKTDLAALTRDALDGTARWSASEVYTAINMALMTWADKVRLPYLYTLPSGYAAGTLEYTLPAYIRPPIYPEVYLPSPYYEHAIESYTYEWRELLGWDYQPDGEGAHTLTVYNPRSEAGQVWFYAPNSRVPTTLPTTSGSTSSTATSMTIGSAVDVDDVGVVKVDAEYISYAGVDRAASTTTLNNLVHELYGSTAATHNTSSTVYWCVGADTMALYQLLYNQVRSILAQMTLFKGSTGERAEYEKLMGYYQQLADEYFKMYNPARPNTGLRLNRKAFAFR